jgi:hypothetical protein
VVVVEELKAELEQQFVSEQQQQVRKATALSSQ